MNEKSWKFSDEHRRKISENHARYWKGKKRFEEAKRKTSKSMKGKNLGDK